jgi:hypothetical protein
MYLILTADVTGRVEYWFAAGVGGLLVIYLLYSGVIQKTFAALKEAGDAGDKQIAALKASLAAAESDRDTWKSDAERMLRESVLMKDAMASDAEKIRKLDDESGAKSDTIIILRRDLEGAYERLNKMGKGTDVR